MVSVKDLWSKVQGYTVWEKTKLRRARQLGSSVHCGPARWVVWGWGLETPGYPISPHYVAVELGMRTMH